jgi:collagen beta-1,O-galactosyltransferase
MRDHVNEEKWLRNIPFKNRRGIINPSYTHWTVSYALTLEGAKKLVNADPLSKILPVDEYLPLMFDKQPK